MGHQIILFLKSCCSQSFRLFLLVFAFHFTIISQSTANTHSSYYSNSILHISSGYGSSLKKGKERSHGNPASKPNDTGGGAFHDALHGQADNMDDPQPDEVEKTNTITLKDVFLFCEADQSKRGIRIAISFTDEDVNYIYYRINGIDDSNRHIDITKISNDFRGLPEGRYDLYVIYKGVSKYLGRYNLIFYTSNPLDIDEIATYKTRKHASCFLRPDGEFSIIASGGKPPYQFSADLFHHESDWQYSNYFNDMQGDRSYIPKVKDANGCVNLFYHTRNLELSYGNYIGFKPRKLEVKSLKYNNSCFGEDNGNVYITVEGGYSGRAYSVDRGATWHASDTWSYAEIGLHNIQVAQSYDHTCVRNDGSFTITELDTIAIDSINFTHATCNNLNDGTITVYVQSTSNNLEYSFNGGVSYQSSNMKSNCLAGDYSVVVRNKNATYCSTSAILVQITQPTPLGFVSVLLEHPTCNGDESGRIEMFPTGGSGQYLFSFDGGASFASSASMDNLGAGAYNIAIADEAVSYCQLADNVEIIEPDELLISGLTIQDVTCFGGSNGSIEIQPQGGSGTYEYSINGGTSWHTSALFANLSKSTLLPAIRDVNDNSCVYYNAPIEITEPDKLLINSIIIEDATCFGGSNASVEIDAVGGSGDYDFSLDGGATFQDTSFFYNIPANDYMPLIRDHFDASCLATHQAIEVAQPVGLGISSIAIDTVTCFGGSNGNIELFAEGGSGNYGYSFDGGLSYSPNPRLDNCLAGEYNIMIRDAMDYQCTLNGGMHHVPEYDLLQITSVTPADLTCNNAPTGSIEIHTQGGSGAFEYSIDNGVTFSPGTMATNLAAEEYTVAIREQNDYTCLSNTVEQTIAQPPPLTIVAHEIETVTCFGSNEGEIRLSANGGSGVYEYSIDNGTNWQGASTFPNLASGTYPVALRDFQDASCQFQYTDIFIPQENEINIHNTNITPADCYGWATGEVEIFASGGTGTLQYSIDDGNIYQANQLFTGLANGDDIHVVVADSKYTYCSVQGVDDVMSQVDELQFSDIQIIDVDCKGNSNGSIQIIASGGSSVYEYSNDGGLTYQAPNTFTHLAPQTYNIWLRDKNAVHCVTETVEAVTEPIEAIHLQSIQEPVVKSNYHGVNVTQCGENDGWFTIFTEGGSGSHRYRYTKEASITDYQAENTFIELPAGLYKVEVQDENACVLELPIVLRDTAEMEANIISIQHTGCGTSNGSATIEVQGGVAPYTFYWDDIANTQSNTASNLSAGAYRCWVYDANNCYVDVPVGISNTDAPDVQISDIKEVTCWYSQDGEAEIDIVSGDAPYEILWSDDFIQSSLRATKLMKGTYLAEVTDVNGCKTVTEVNVPGPEKLLPGQLDITQPLCFGDNNAAIEVSAVGGVPDYSFTLRSGAVSYPAQDGESAVFDADIMADTYYLHIEDARLCIHDETITIEEPEVLGFTTNSTIDPSCFGFADGSIAVSAQGGIQQNGNYTFTLNAESYYTQQATFTSLEHGTYTITVQDDNACSAQVEQKLAEPPLLQVENLQYDEPLCHGETNQYIAASATGGTPSTGDQYTFSLFYGGALQGEMLADAAGFRHFPAGEYTLQTMDLHSCLAREEFTITEPDTLSTKNIRITDLKCNSYPYGIIELSAQGGETADGSYGFTLFKSGAQLGQQQTERAWFGKLYAGGYVVQITDDNQCTIEQKLNLDQPDKVEFSDLNTEDAKCSHQNTGELQFGIKGGASQSGSYDIDIYKDNKDFWSGHQNNFHHTGLNAGFYTIVANDDNNCPLRASLEIKEPLQLKINHLQINPVRCHNDKNASIQLKIEGGTSLRNNYTAVLTDNQGLEITKNGGGVYFSALQSNEYSISVSDANNCNIDTIITIENPPPLELQTTITQLPLCFNSKDGEMQLLASGGTADKYSYSVTHNNNSPTVFQPSGHEALFSNLESGLYSIQLVDEKLCSLDTMLQIQAPPPLQIATLDIAPPRCHGSNDASLQVAGAGGASQSQIYNYQLSRNGGSSQMLLGNLETFHNLCAGEYQLTIEDDNSCYYDSSFTITAPLELYFENPAISDVSCNGNADGSLKTSVKGGTTIGGVYNYILTRDTQIVARSINTYVSMKGLHAGNYEISAQDMNGCSADTIFAVSEPSKIIIEDVQVAPTLCGGDKNNSVYAKAIGGVPIQGGYLYEIQSIDTLINKIYDVSAQFEKLDGGDFYIAAYDKNNCKATAVANIIEPQKLVFEAVNMKNISCFGYTDGGITAKAHGGTTQNGYTYTFNHGQKLLDKYSGEIFTRENLAPGSYSITIQDDNNCTREQAVNIQEPDPVYINFLTPYDSECAASRDGKINIGVSGGQAFYGYAFYFYQDGEVMMSYQGAEDNRDEIEGFYSGDYKVRVEDFYHCSDSAEFEIKGPPPLVASLEKSDVVCKGKSEGGASLGISGGNLPYHVRWLEGHKLLAEDVYEINGLESGDYTCHVTDANNCPRNGEFVGIYLPFTISQPEGNVKIEMIEKVDPLGYGESTGMASFSADGGYGGYEFDLNQGGFSTASVFTGLDDGKYKATVRDKKHCRDSLYFRIEEPEKLELFIHETGGPKCKGDETGMISVSGEGGIQPYTFSIDDGQSFQDTNVFTGLGKGKYTIVMKDANGYSAQAAVDISEPPEYMAYRITQLYPTACNKAWGKIAVQPVGGSSPYTYAWEGHEEWSSYYVTQLAGGVYSFTISDKYGCQVKGSAEVAEGEKPEVASENINHVSCFSGNNGSAQITAKGQNPPFIYEWQNIPEDQTDNNKAFQLEAGNYELKITDAMNCFSMAEIEITQPDSISIEIREAVNPLCYEECNGSALVEASGGSGGHTFSWEDENKTVFSNSHSISDACQGIYTVFVKDSKNCAASKQINLVAPPGFGIQMADSFILCTGEQREIDPGFPDAEINWLKNGAPFSNNNIVSITEEGKYTLLVRNFETCTKRHDFNVLVKDDALKTNFLMADTALVTDTIVIIDVSEPLPSGIQWDIPPEFSDVTLQETPKWIQATQAGIYTIGLSASLAQCMGHYEKNIVVLDSYDNDLKYRAKGTWIKEIVLYPNPNKGIFYVNVVLLNRSSIEISVSSMLGQENLAYQQCGETLSNNFEFNLPFLKPGIYVIDVKTKDDEKFVKFTVEGE